ncbi:MAG: hypothetical protein WCT41_03880 [Candidatus Paceibacterota bacterium]|jgi:hypothetical protein
MTVVCRKSPRNQTVNETRDVLLRRSGNVASPAFPKKVQEHFFLPALASGEYEEYSPLVSLGSNLRSASFGIAASECRTELIPKDRACTLRNSFLATHRVSLKGTRVL